VVLYDPLATMGVRVGQDIAVVVERLA